MKNSEIVVLYLCSDGCDGDSEIISESALAGVESHSASSVHTSLSTLHQAAVGKSREATDTFCK